MGKSEFIFNSNNFFKTNRRWYFSLSRSRNNIFHF